ncbi:MAG: glycosyltransferase, partial [Gemmatimonadota bacterium]|nr:glycosyltransferase [Gemmatimonadota bacterium]
MSSPRVSVIIPAYETAPFIVETLESVFAQTFDDYEVIVVNDGSPDTALLERVLQPFRERICYIAQENKGVSAARNAGLRVARGPYAAMLDSDDKWYPEYLASQVAVLDAEPEVHVVYCDVVQFDERGLRPKRLSEILPMGGDVSFQRVLARECQVNGQAMARRDSLLQLGGYDENIPTGEDFELWLRVLKAGKRIAYNDRVLAQYRVREGSLSSDDLRMSSDVLGLIERLSTKMTLSREERAIVERQRTKLLGTINLLEGKRALVTGDSTVALHRLAAARAHLGGWKLGLVVAMLR